MKMRRKKGKSKRSKRNRVSAETEYSKAPHTFVFHRGTVGKSVVQLLRDTRRTMEPFTAVKLRARKKNVLKDFVSVASPLGVTHFMVFTKTDTGPNLRIIKIPRGPTVTFKIKQYSLARDVVSSLKRPNMYASQFRYHPLLILNNFSKDQPHLKLTATVLQNMFPSINVHKVHLNNIRRCVLFNYDPETELIEFRHYSIKLVPVGVSRSAKKLLKTKVPDLSRYKDVSDFFLNAGQLSESEAEQDGPDNEVTVPQSMSSRGNITAQKSAIRLIEIGPRMQLQMVKIEEGLCEGEVIYHHFVQKTPQEVSEARTRRLEKLKEKEKRKKLQKVNVEAKMKKREEHKQKSLQGIKRKRMEEKSLTKGVEEEVIEEDPDDDSEYYRQEVGEDPDPALFPKQKRPPNTVKRKESNRGSRIPKKKMKSGSETFRDRTRGETKGKAGRNVPKSSRSFDREPLAKTGKKPGKFRGKTGPQSKFGQKGERVNTSGVKHRKGKVLGGKVKMRSKVKGR